MKKIAPDKWKHFFVGIVMGSFLQAFMIWFMPGHPIIDTVAALILSMTISYGFELFSLVTGKGHYEVMDAVAGTIGGVIGMVMILLIEFSFKK
jgi:VanZ family protein